MCKVSSLKWLHLIVFTVINSTAIYSQNLSGNITNVFAAVQATTANTVTVNNAAGFVAGDKVLLIQMQGAAINSSNTASFGDITAYNTSGNFEFLTIASIAGTTITFTGNMVKTYSTSGKVQLVKVAVHNCPVITATVTCIPWNGTTGGIIALETPGTLLMNAGIDAVGAGFRGQPFCIGGFGCVTYGWALNNGNCDGAKKGEGIAAFITGQDGGKGKQANGGGGGDPSNSGGGGGANGGVGGQGGDSYSGCGGGLNNNGRGGAVLDYSIERAFLGGSGGTGFNDNSQTVTSGGSGGGLVFINAADITGNGNSINASGQSVPVIANDESAGGGGAGGGVYLSVNNFQSLTINVSGGSGGSTYNNIFISDCHAPGGGGGGGIAWFKSASLPAGVTVIKSGGAAGTVQNPQSSCYNTSFGAQAGAAGIEKYNLTPVPLATVPPIVFSLGNDTTVCTGQNVVLNAGSGFSSYLWQNGSTGQTFTATTAGTYYCTVSSGCGTATDTVVITTTAAPVFFLGNDTAICAGQTVQLSVNGPFNAYSWQDGSTQQTYTATTAGTYYCSAVSACGTARDTIIITTLNSASFSLGNDTAVCPGQPVQLTVTGPFNSYVWQNGSTAPTYTATAAGTYYCTATGNCGTATDTIVISDNLSTPTLNLGNDTTVCAGAAINLQAPGGFTSYVWQNGSTGNLFTATAPGIYYCTGYSNCGNATDTIVINNFAAPAPFNLGNDTVLCSGNQITLTAGAGYSTYTWQNGTTLPVLTVTNTGLYYCAATYNCGAFTDSITITYTDTPAIELGPDLLLCSGDKITVTAYCAGCSYVWQNNTTLPAITIEQAGTYAVIATNSCGSTSDAVRAEVENCDCKIFIPNAFSPNGDGVNDLFLAGYKCTVVYFRLMVFNRWGEKVFEALNPNEGWDGNWKSTPQPPGVYTYALSYTGDEGRETKNYKAAGSLTLIR